MTVAEHEEARRHMFPDDTPEEFITRICNEGAVLPQHQVDGGVFHAPATWMGATETIGFDDDIPDPRAYGWRRKKFMLVLPSPSGHDVNCHSALSTRSAGGRFLRKQLEAVGFKFDDIMVTYAVRFVRPEHLKSYNAKHKSSCLPYVLRDLEECRPEVILVFGADAFKALYGSKSKTSVHRGGVLEYEYSDGTKAKVIPTISHLSFLGNTAGLDVFQEELRKAFEIGSGLYKPKGVLRDYTICRTVPEVEALLQRIRRDRPTRIAFDTEFGNDVARSEFRYTLSIQLSWAYGTAATILLRTQMQDPNYWQISPVGKPRKKDGRAKLRCKELVPHPRCGIPYHSKEDEQRIWKMVSELLNDKSWKLVAHHIRVDAEQFHREGFPIDERVEDGFDTMLANHLLFGDEDQGLDDLVRKYAPEYGAYWAPLEEWLSSKGSNPGDNRLGRQGALEYGYRNIPDSILIPYGLDDAASTWVVGQHVEAELEKRQKLKDLYWNHVAPTSLHLLDVQRHGILVDEERRMQIRDLYLPVYEDFVKQLRELLNWPDFNPGSPHDIRAALFRDEQHLEKKAAPPGAKVLNIRPLCNTDKYPRMWSELVADGVAHLHRPSTKAVVLELLQQQHPNEVIIRLLKHTSAVGKLLSTYLSPVETNSHGVPTDGAGFHCNIWADGRVRTNLSQLTETGRYTSKRANLQTSPKKQEAAILEALVWHKFQIPLAEYKRRTFDGAKDKSGAYLKPPYTGPDAIPEEERVHTIPYKTVFVARPGYSFIEVDFQTAELCIWAYCSGDQTLIDIVDSGRDFHAEVAARAFKLEPERCQAAVDALKNGDRKAYAEWKDYFKKAYESQRIAAKTVNFGVMYGRGAVALAREIRNQGVEITTEGAQQIIDQVAADFPVAWGWLVANAKFAVENEYIENAFGRCRYFTGARHMSNSDRAAVERAAKNSPIQGAVADLLARAGVNLYRLKYRTKIGRSLDFQVNLPIHDAFLVEVKDEHIDPVVKALELCMSTRNTLPGTNYRLKLDIEVMKRWGEH